MLIHDKAGLNEMPGMQNHPLWNILESVGFDIQ